RNVRLNVACEKITPNSRKIAIESATIAGVRLRRFSGRVVAVAGDITCQGVCRSMGAPNLTEPRERKAARPDFIIPAVQLALGCSPSCEGWLFPLRGWLGQNGPWKHRASRTDLAPRLLLVTILLP